MSRDPEADEVAATQLAVDSQIEKRELAHPVFHLKAHPKCPDVLDFERGLLAHDLALVPWLAMSGVDTGFHDGLLPS